MIVLREISRIIDKRLADNKVLILSGARQVGKSTLIREMSKKFTEPVLWLNGDDADIRTRLKDTNSGYLKTFLGNTKTLVIDEAQRIENIGLTLKIIADTLPEIKVVVTGSSSFELANKINEPLTGRKWEFNLYPFSFGEMVNDTNLLAESRLLKHRLVFGYYPEVVLHPGEEAMRLKELANSYLYKDILTWERIQKPEKMEKLVQAIAFQVGNEVSFHELGQTTGLDNQTVEKYINLLEQAFILFRLPSLSRNLRNELKKSRKIYFYDNGLRNAVINQFNPLDLRADTGALWENFLMSERIKQLAYQHISCNRYFWRTTAQQEIDYIEERNGLMTAYEFKWNTNRAYRVPKTFLQAYPQAKTSVINLENAAPWLLEKFEK